MNKKKIIILCLIVYLILREISFFNFSLFKSFSDSNNTFNESSKIMSYDYNDKYEELPEIDFNNSESYEYKFYGLNEINTQEVIENENLVNITVSYSTDISLLKYLPLIKPLSFSSSGTYNWHTNILSGDKVYHISGIGNFNLVGDIDIYGICSGKSANNEIDDLISNQIKKNIIGKIEKQLNPIKTKANIGYN